MNKAWYMAAATALWASVAGAQQDPSYSAGHHPVSLFKGRESILADEEQPSRHSASSNRNGKRHKECRGEWRRIYKGLSDSQIAWLNNSVHYHSQHSIYGDNVFRNLSVTTAPAMHPQEGECNADARWYDHVVTIVITEGDKTLLDETYVGGLPHILRPELLPDGSVQLKVLEKRVVPIGDIKTKHIDAAEDHSYLGLDCLVVIDQGPSFLLPKRDPSSTVSASITPEGIEGGNQ